MASRRPITLRSAAVYLAVFFGTLWLLHNDAKHGTYIPCWQTTQHTAVGINDTSTSYYSRTKPLIRAGFASGVTFSGEAFLVGGNVSVSPVTCRTR